jgi:hypothetical protein
MHVIGGELWVREFVLLQGLPHTCINVGFVVYVEPQNMTIFSDRYNKVVLPDIEDCADFSGNGSPLPETDPVPALSSCCVGRRRR